MAIRRVLLCAGGTGGHLFPAEAVAHELVARGYTVHLAADERVRRFSENFPAEEVHIIKSATMGSKNPVAVARMIFRLFQGYLESRSLLKQLNPVAVAGFGGYPTVPPVVAASSLGIPTLVHEANAVLGRANRLLARRVDRVAIGFGSTSKVGGIPVTVTGNPVRPAITSVAGTPYPTRKRGDAFFLLVFGGSQGAAFFGETVPAACRLLPDKIRDKLHVVQQARPEDIESVRSVYSKAGINAVVETFFSDMEKRLAQAHLVISRAGASTVSELAVVGRPAILVPYPHALDHDQASNAATVEAAGGVKIFEQHGLDADTLAAEIKDAFDDPKKLALAAKKAKKTGKPDAAARLADMIEDLASGKSQ